MPHFRIDPFQKLFSAFAGKRTAIHKVISFVAVAKNLPGPEVMKHFSCSTQLSMKFVLFINLKLLTNANSFLLNIAEHENFSAK